MNLILFKKFTPQSTLLISFVTVIILGAFFLSQPFSLADSKLSFIDALFTSTSATCVTGLAVVDTASHFSIIGKIILLILIQLGGLGVMSFSVLFLFFLRGKFSIGNREIIQETLALFGKINIADLLKSVFIYTVVIEIIGTILLTSRFLLEMSFSDSLFFAIFHSISAFCNAGFSIFPNSLVQYQSDIFVNVVISSLIISGGLGFIVLYELKSCVFNKKKLKSVSLHSKIVLKVSLGLIVAGALFLFLFEYNVSMSEMNLKTKILSSLFQSITARTAGFNTIDIYTLSIPSLFFILVLMFIGASPASTGGGIKTTTIVVLFVFLKSRIKDSKNVNIGFNTIPFKIVSKALIVIVFGIVIVVVSSFLLTVFELNHISFSGNEDRFLEIVFETVSAFGTVGLSTGITSDFSVVGKIIIVGLMLLGRLGPLTVALAIGSKGKKDIKYAEENLLIG